MPIKLQRCPVCKEKKMFRTDVKTCGEHGTNPFPKRTALPKAETPEKQAVTNEQIADIELQKLRDKRENKDANIRVLQERVLKLEAENEVFEHIKSLPSEVIKVSPKAKAGVSESAAVILWSDWHSEERVTLEQTSGKNEFNLEIFHHRFWNLLRGNICWFNINAEATTINTIVLALIGDFITGSIHADLAEGNLLPPADAVHRVMQYIITGIDYILANTAPNVGLIIPCHSGNHGRMTMDQRIATEAGNSLEYFMYLMLADHYKDNDRVDFRVQAGYHSYIDFFDGAFTMRTHHGHQINYQGGVGGITIPVNKAIAQWNKARHADLDAFGHFHTKFDGGNFVSNGALIGYSAYAVSIKGTFEEPSQQMFLINREYKAKTAVMPVFVKDPVF